MTRLGGIPTKYEVEVRDMVTSQNGSTALGEVLGSGNNELNPQSFEQSVACHDDRRIRDVAHSYDGSGANVEALADQPFGRGPGSPPRNSAGDDI